MDCDENQSDSLLATTDNAVTSAVPFGETISTPQLSSIETIRYSPESGTYRTEFDVDRDTASEVVVHSVAAVADQSPLDLDPLYDVIDPDALDSLVRSSTRSDSTDDVRVTFAFCGHDVTLHSYGTIDVTSSD